MRPARAPHNREAGAEDPPRCRRGAVAQQRANPLHRHCEGQQMNDPPVVVLRPLTHDDVAALEAARTQEADPFNWAGYQDAGGLAAAITRRETLREDGGTLA